MQNRFTKERRTVTPSRREHYPALEGLRGIAALMILLHHFVQLGPTNSPLHSMLRSATLSLWTGVDLFFVLSGFLITGILADHHGSPNYFRSFYGRRILRIFPLYYGVLFLSFYVFPFLSFEPNVLPSQRIAFWTYTSNFLFLQRGWVSEYLTHFWSLAMEEQFYLVIPAIVFFVKDLDRLRRFIPFAIIGLIGLRIGLYFSGARYHVVYFDTITRCDGLLIGAWLALRIRSKSQPLVLTLTRYRAAGLLSFALLTIYLAQSLQFNDRLRIVVLSQHTIMFTMLALVALVGVMMAISETPNPVQRFFMQPTLRRVGKYSYGLYVLHVPVAIGVDRVMERLGLTFAGPSIVQELSVLVVFGSVTAVVSYISWHLFEKLFLKLKRLFPYSSVSVSKASPIPVGSAASL